MLTDPRKDLESLHSGLNSPNADVRFDAVQAVRARTALEALRPFIYLSVSDQDDDVRREASWGLGELIRAGIVKPQEIYVLLMTFVTDHDENKRAFALRALSRIPQDDASLQTFIPDLIRCLADPVPTVRQQAAFFFFKCPRQEAKQALEKCLNDESIDVREWTAKALEGLAGDEDVVK